MTTGTPVFASALGEPLLAVYDDVLPNGAYRAWALAQPRQTIITEDEHWHGLAVTEDLTLPDLIAARLAGATTRLTFFRQSPEGQVEPNYIHSDEGMGEWTAILYLNDPPPAEDGTAFWRYRPTQATRGSARALPSTDLSLWEPWHVVPARLNRLLIFDSLYFHSRCMPQNYGTGDDARFVQVAFGTVTKPVDAHGIRVATVGDLPALVALGQRFREESVYADRLAENPDQMVTLGTKLLSEPHSTIFALERQQQIVGMIGLTIFPHPISGVITAAEVIFWVNPDHRGHGLALLRRAEAWARAKGATTLQLVAPTREVETLYQRLGYAVWEVAYVKELH